jgi:hypothetical protein
MGKGSSGLCSEQNRVKVQLPIISLGTLPLISKGNANPIQLLEIFQNQPTQFQ